VSDEKESEQGLFRRTVTTGGALVQAGKKGSNVTSGRREGA
jgi:hypothetical protein